MIETTTNEQAVTPATPATETQSLAEYRAWRENKPAAERTEAKTEETAQTDTASSSRSHLRAALGVQTATTEDSVGETAEDSEPSEDETQGTEGETKPKKKGGYQRTIDKLKSELDEIRGQLAGNKPAVKPAEATPAPQVSQFTEPEPQLEDFENIGQYTKALLKWDRAQASYEQAQQAAARQQATQQQAVIQGWNERQADAKAKHADYDAALAAVQEIAIPPAMQHALLESEHGPEVAYHLAKNPDELKRIVALSPLAAARAIGKLESVLSSEAAAAPQKNNKISSAPAPIRTVSGKPAAGAFDVKNASLRDYRLAREQGRVR